MVKNARNLVGRFIAGLILGFYGVTTFGASLNAELDRTQIENGQSVTLTVTARDVDGEIDLTGLEKDFDILETSRSKSVQIVNGKSDSSLSWRVGLMPKRGGTLLIPPFAIGNVRSEPIELAVRETDPQSAIKAGREYFVEIEVDDQQPFVQQQVLLTVRVYMANSIIEGSLGGPEVKNALIERLGNDSNNTTILNERQYQVTERRYAIFAQQSGTLGIPPLQLDATIRERDGSGSTRGFFTPTRKLRLGSNSLTLEVRPKPAASKSVWWLPAQALSLTADWSDDITSVRVDEPITRSISLSVKGLHSTQLPTLSPPQIANAKVYADQADMRDESLSDAVVSYRTDKWAIIPRQAGPLEVPEIKLEWYDTINNEIRYAVLPAETIEVLPTLTTGKKPEAAESVTPIPSHTEKPEQKSMPVTPAESSASDTVVVTEAREEPFPWWPWITGFVLVGWFVTLVLWRLSARGKSLDVPTPGPVKASRLAGLVSLEHACAKGDPLAIGQAALGWAAEQWPENPPRNLAGLAKKLRSPRLGELFAQLDAALYSQTSGTIECTDLVKEIRSAIDYEKNNRGSLQKENLLPQL